MLWVWLSGCVWCGLVASRANAAPTIVFSGDRARNNLVSDLLEVRAIAAPGATLTFTRATEGWIFITARPTGRGTATLTLDGGPPDTAVTLHDGPGPNPVEAFRRVTGGAHRLRVECGGGLRLEALSVRAVCELIGCGLLDPAIKGYGHYDLAFLQRDVLPNITTLIVPVQPNLSPEAIADWHRQGKKLVVETGVSGQATNAEGHFQYWTRVFDQAPFADGIIIDEFIVNRPAREWDSHPNLQGRLEEERRRHKVYEAALKRIRADERYRAKTVYAYIGGSGRKLNEETIGPTFVATLIGCRYPIALERYLFERSSPSASERALAELVDGIADWEAKAPGAKPDMIVTGGLFSMPPGSIDKLPNVDFHVWMDQQMNVIANDPALAHLAGLNWWTSSLADEETVRFVGKLYRHYALEGKKDPLTHDPLFMTHLANADFQDGVAGWTLHPAEPGAIHPERFPRYGRIEGRYMGLGRPPDPEHIGDTFLVLNRSALGPNTFSQTVKALQPGRLYSLKLLTCDYQDLLHPAAKTMEQAAPCRTTVTLDGVDLDSTRSFSERYASSPEPKIPVWITYHWFVFRARGTTARLTVSDWESATPAPPFGQQQTFNFLELQPYHE